MKEKIIEMCKLVIKNGIGYRVIDCEGIECKKCPFECCEDIDSEDIERAKNILKTNKNI